MDEGAVVWQARAVSAGGKLTPHSILDILGRGRKRGREEEEREPLPDNTLLQQQVSREGERRRQGAPTPAPSQGGSDSSKEWKTAR